MCKMRVEHDEQTSSRILKTSAKKSTVYMKYQCDKSHNDDV